MSARAYRVITLPHVQKTLKTAKFYACQFRVSLKMSHSNKFIQKACNGQKNTMLLMSTLYVSAKYLRWKRTHRVILQFHLSLCAIKT